MPLDGIVAMTDAEKEVTLNLNSDTITKFTVDNFNTYNRLRVMEAFPRIFGSQAPNWLKYSHSGLVNISDIDMDNKQFEQAARVNVNPKMPEMRLDFKFNGFSLAELGIMLAKVGNGKYIVLEGRTRLKLLIEMGMTNIIAEIFEKTSLTNMVKFAIFMNSSKKMEMKILIKIC